MRTRDLAAEMRQHFADLTLEDAEMLVDLGISAWLVDFYQMVGVATVQGSQEEPLYAPQRGGELALITPALGHYLDTPETPDPDLFCRVGELIDLVAWHPRCPHRWALRTGTASWLGCIDRLTTAPSGNWGAGPLVGQSSRSRKGSGLAEVRAGVPSELEGKVRRYIERLDLALLRVGIRVGCRLGLGSSRVITSHFSYTEGAISFAAKARPPPRLPQLLLNRDQRPLDYESETAGRKPNNPSLERRRCRNSFMARNAKPGNGQLDTRQLANRATAHTFGANVGLRFTRTR